MRRRNVNEPVLAADEKPSRIAEAFKSFDIVSDKVEEENAEYTSTGALVTIITLVIATMLFIFEVQSYMAIHVEEHLRVDTRANDKLPIHFNFTFPRLRCSQTHLDVVDKGGDQNLDVVHDIIKQRHDQKGKNIGAPIDAEKEDLDALAADEDEHEGCTIAGRMEVNRVEGKFHVCIGRTQARSDRVHAHFFKYTEARTFDASHRINELYFGDVKPDEASPLDGEAQHLPFVAHYNYFVEIVPMQTVSLDGSITDSDSYSFTKHTTITSSFDHTMTEKTIPGLFFNYKLSAFMVQRQETERRFSDFATSCFAILGGLFAISGLIDSIIYHATQQLFSSSSSSLSTSSGGAYSKLNDTTVGLSSMVRSNNPPPPPPPPPSSSSSVAVPSLSPSMTNSSSMPSPPSNNQVSLRPYFLMLHNTTIKTSTISSYEWGGSE